MVKQWSTVNWMHKNKPFQLLRTPRKRADQHVDGQGEQRTPEKGGKNHQETECRRATSLPCTGIPQTRSGLEGQEL